MYPLDIYRSAKLLIDQHGDQAPMQARIRTMSLRQDDDEQGAAVWQHIFEAILELQRTMRDPEEAVH